MTGTFGLKHYLLSVVLSFGGSITDTDDSGRRLNLKLDDNNYVHDVGFY